MNKFTIYASLLVPVAAVATARWIAHEPAIPPNFRASRPEQRQAPRRRVEFRHPGGWRPPGEPDHRRGRPLRTHSNPESFRFGWRNWQALVEIRLGDTRNTARSR